VPDLYTALGWIGRRVDDVQGARIGTVQDIFVDLGTPRWLVVGAGRSQRPELAVPVERVAVQDDGRLVVSCSAASAGRAALGQPRERLAHDAVCDQRGDVGRSDRAGQDLDDVDAHQVGAAGDRATRV
jgi:hypothetical protein